MTATLLLGPNFIQKGIEIDPGFGAVTTIGQAASKEDSSSQAIIKFQHPSSLEQHPPWDPGYTSIYITISTLASVCPYGSVRRHVTSHFQFLSCS